MMNAQTISTAFQTSTFGEVALGAADASGGQDAPYHPEEDADAEMERRVRQRTEWYGK